MAHIPSNFWHGWIVLITLVSLAAVIWLVLSVYFSSESPKEEEPVWDDTLEEGPNPPPLWWFWLILGSTVFSLIYLMLYPGFGSYTGLLNWSQGSQADSRRAEYEARFSGPREHIAAMSLVEIQHDIDLMAAAERIYQRECSACHGPEARGQVSQFPSLMDVDWQWGGSPQAIEQTIRYGRIAFMQPWAGVLSEAQTGNVVAYVQSLQSDSNAAPSATLTAGQAVFNQYCAVCHGADATGNQLLGAPDLTNGIWLYGGDTASLTRTIRDGRNGIMPPFNHRLDDTQIHLLTALLAR